MREIHKQFLQSDKKDDSIFCPEKNCDAKFKTMDYLGGKLSGNTSMMGLSVAANIP